MGHVIHMLEADDLLFRDERHIGEESSRSHRDYQQEIKVSNIGYNQKGERISDTSEDDSSRNHHQPTRQR
ncbi:Serine/threonine protein kinase [Quillaja saponaria]|uniref:Serine/threonine protein kinase n=1 Tax=Quillaja saponaria TaxID=32244 RepID=A0AAD7LQX6_QUISA|nr:Serine/threonine protein kinase [Quillaja saponaria]